MTQQQINTLSITDPPIDGIDDSVILATQDHIQGSPAVTKVFTTTDVNIGTDIITATAHGFIDDIVVYLRTTGNLPGGLSPYVAYYVVNSTLNTLQLSTTSGGAAIDLTSVGVGNHYLLTGIRILQNDPWDVALKIIDLMAVDPINQVPAMDVAVAPTALNRFVTLSDMGAQITGKKDFILVGPTGSGADFEGNDESPFNAAITFIQSITSTDGGWIIVLPGTYTFSTTLVVSNGIRIEGQHPSLVTLQVTSGNLAVVNLQGNSCGLFNVTIENPTAITKAAVVVSGQRCSMELVKITNFGYVGLQLGGFRNKVNVCRFDSFTANSVAVIAQGGQNNLNQCSFVGSLPNGAFKTEGDGCGIFSSHFGNGIIGFAYQIGFPYMTIPNPSVNDNRIVGNHFDSVVSLLLSDDNGTDSVRYANTPNLFDANQNNFLVPFAAYVGQSTVAVSIATLSNTFTHDPLISDNLTDLLDHTAGPDIFFPTGRPSLDLLMKRSYEERNFFLHSVDPTYNIDGTPASGTFSWDGTNLVYPQFYLRSTLARPARWVVNAGSTALAAGEVLFIDIDQSLNGVDIVLTPTIATIAVALTDPTDAYRLVLAVGFSGGTAIWLQGFRLLTAQTSFDVDGTFLPLVRFIGMTEAKNPAAPGSGFSGAANSNLTVKMSAQSAHLKELFERTNLTFQPLTEDAEMSTDPIPGSWLTGMSITSGIPSAPTHLVECRTQTYGLNPATGLYKYSLSGAGWSIIPGIPLAGPYTALSKVGTSLALLKTNGQIVTYSPDTLSWVVYSPALAPKVATLVPFASSRPLGFMTGGQSDYQLQTDTHSYFTTLNGHTVRYSLVANKLEWVPRAFTQDVGDNGLLSHSLKDTGYNCLRSPNDQFESLDNGVSFTTGLPIGSKGKFLPLLDSHYDEFKSTDFSSLIIENFSHDKISGSHVSVYRNAGTTKWYVIGGGLDKSYLYAVLPTTDALFSDFTPQFWAVHAGRQEVICVGKKTSTTAFAMLRGYFDVFSNSWLWVSQTPGGANTCQGAIAVYDDYPGGFNYGDLWVIVSNPARGDRPSIWKRDGVSGVWTFKTLMDVVALPEDVLVPAAVSTSFNYNRTTDPLAGYGLASPQGISFLVKDTARTNRPTLFRFNRAVLTYSGVRLTDAGVDIVNAQAVSNCTVQCYGSGYHVGTRTNYWVFRDAGTITRLFMLHEDSGGTSTWSAIQIATTGLTLPFTNRSGNQFCVNNISETYLPASSARYVYLLTNDGITKVILSGSVLGLALNQSFVPAAVDIGTETITLFDHGLLHNDKVTFTSTGALPGGLTAGVEYAITNVAASTFQLSTTTDGALVNLTTQGTGTHTFMLSNDDYVSTANVPCFSLPPCTPYISIVGFSRGGEPSIQIGSWVLDATSLLPPQGCALGNDPNLGGAIFWGETGTALKNLGLGLWAGLNRGGYLWIADASKSMRMTEFKPNTITVRGHIIVPNLGTTTDFSFAFDPTNTKIAFVFADGNNANQIGFVLYNLATQKLEAYERAGLAPFNPFGTSACGSVPRIALNTFDSSWCVTVQDDSRLGGQLAFYRRPTGSSAWTLERVGSEGGADKSLSSMGALAGLSPSAPLPQVNGDVVVATQNTAAGNLLVVYRIFNTNTWATSANLTGGGTVAPELIYAGSTYWVAGSSDGVLAQLASSTSYASGWSYVTNPLSVSYSRVTAGRVFAYNDSIVVASPLSGAPANQEFGVFKFTNLGVARGQIFAAMGELQSAFYSGEEETSYSNHSWTFDGKLLYGALRPSRADMHYSIRVSRTSWFGLGDSSLGSGRLISIGERTYREEVSDGSQDLITEYDFNHAFIRTWTDLPLAERDLGNFTALRYPFNADGGASSLFKTGNPSAGLMSDGTLQSGTLGAVATRDFPLISELTRIQGRPDSGVLYNGGLLTLFAPPSTTSLLYFGTATIAASNMFKLNPQDTLTIKGTWGFKALNDNARSYTITGPLAFNLDGSVNGHLVLDFNIPSSLVLDSVANPLSYWVSLNHTQTSYEIVLGELQSKFFAIYPSAKMDSRVIKLTLGSLELPDLVEPIYLVRYCAPVSQLCINKVISERFYVEPLDIDSVSVKQVGTLNGFQQLDFALIDGNKHLLVAQGLPPHGAGYYFYKDTTNAVRSEHDGMRIQHVVGRFGDLVVFNSF